MAKHVASADGTKIAIDCRGSGPALVLVEPPLRHRGLSAFDGVAKRLSEHFTVYRYDRRGRGESTDTPPYHPDREVEDLAAAIACAGGSTFVYGYSSGGLLALRAATQLSGISRLAVLEPPLRDNNSTAPDPLTGDLAALLENGQAEIALQHFHRSIGLPDELVSSLESSPDWPRMVKMARTLVYDCMVCDSTPPDMLRAIKARTLVIDSTGSDRSLAESAHRATTLIPGCVRRTIAGEWHTVPDAALAIALIEFFSE